MTLLRFGRFSKAASGAIILLLLGLFLAPASVQAGCNHQVGSSSDLFVNLQHLDPLVFHGSSTSLRTDQGQSPLDQPDAPRRTPCSGFSCSNSLPMPVSTITPSSEGRDRWGALVSLVVVDKGSLYDRAIEEPVLLAAGQITSIFHPPRV
jgi:hypothetical protein